MIKEYTQYLTEKSVKHYNDNKDSFTDLISEINSIDAETPEQKAKAILKAFYMKNGIRPEIMLEKNEFSEILFEDAELKQAFENELAKYQAQEQVAIQLALDNPELQLNGVDLTHYAMKFNPELVDGVLVVNGEPLELVGQEPERFINGYAYNTDVKSMEEQQKLIDAVYAQEQGFSVGEPLVPDLALEQIIDESLEQDFEQEPELSEEFENKKEELAEEFEKRFTSNQELRDAFLADIMKGYTQDKKGRCFDENGRMRMRFESGFCGRTIRGTAPIGVSPDELVALFLKVGKKQVNNLPLQDLPAFREALEKIQDEGLFDLQDITFGRKVDPKVKEVWNEVKNGRVDLGQSIDYEVSEQPEQPEQRNDIENPEQEVSEQAPVVSKQEEPEQQNEIETPEVPEQVIEPMSEQNLSELGENEQEQPEQLDNIEIGEPEIELEPETPQDPEPQSVVDIETPNVAQEAIFDDVEEKQRVAEEFGYTPDFNSYVYEENGVSPKQEYVFEPIVNDFNDDEEVVEPKHVQEDNAMELFSDEPDFDEELNTPVIEKLENAPSNEREFLIDEDTPIGKCTPKQPHQEDVIEVVPVIKNEMQDAEKELVKDLVSGVNNRIASDRQRQQTVNEIFEPHFNRTSNKPKQ